MLWCISRKILGVGQNFLENLEGWPKKFQKNYIFWPKFFFWGGQTLGFFHLVGGSRLSIPTLPAYTPPPPPLYASLPLRNEFKKKLPNVKYQAITTIKHDLVKHILESEVNRNVEVSGGDIIFYGNGIFNKIKFSNFFMSERG
jgi:hypothetical protein